MIYFGKNAMRRIFVPLSLFAVFALTGCGVSGSLRTPPPLFGDKNKPQVNKTQPDIPLPQDEIDQDLQDILDELEE